MGECGTQKVKCVAGHTLKFATNLFNRGLTNGLKTHREGERLIVIHAGSRDGFVAGAAEVFRAKKSGKDYYYQEMNGTRFEAWFIGKLLRKLKPSSVIVIDNASYHSVKVHTAVQISSS